MRRRMSLIMVCLVCLCAFPLTVFSGQIEDTAQQGINALKSGNYGAALKLLTVAIDSREMSGESLALVYYNRGLTYLRTGHWANAIADFSDAIRLKPDLGWAYHNRGLGYYKLGDTRKAFSNFKIACRFGIQNACEAMKQLAGN